MSKIPNLVDLPYGGLCYVISGGQTGADQAGLYAGRHFGITTGGSIAKGFRTALGDDPSLAQFNLVEEKSRAYQPRTWKNASESDGTVRLASNFNTGGEILTLRYAETAKKPILSLLLNEKDYESKAQELVDFIINHSITCLNVAGNADRDQQFGFHFHNALTILNLAFEILQKKNLLIHDAPRRN